MATGWFAGQFLLLCSFTLQAIGQDISQYLPIIKLPENIYFAGTSKGVRGIVPPVLPPADLLSVIDRIASGEEGQGGDEGDTGETTNAEVGGGLLLGVTASTSGANLQFKKVAARKPSLGFDGIDSYTQRYSGSAPKYNGTQNKNTPPDSSLCVGNGFLLQTVNYAMSVYSSENGTLLAGATVLNEFLNAFPMKVIDRKTNTTSIGDFFSDGSCVFDPLTKRFFFTALWRSGGQKNRYDEFGNTRTSATGATTGSGLVVAASKTGDPRNEWNLFFIPGINDGIHSNNDSSPPLNNPYDPPFFPDYPRTGLDAHGLYIGATQFDKFSRFISCNIYALSKDRLLAPSPGKFSPFPATRLVLADWYTISPLFSVGGIFPVPPLSAESSSPYDTSRGGTIFFASTMRYGEDNYSLGKFRRMAVWALTNTKVLRSRSPQAQIAGLKMQYAFVDTPNYYSPNPAGASQKKGGPRPYGDSVNRNESTIANSNVRIMGLMMRNGSIWAVFHTGVGANLDVGIVVAKLKPRFESENLTAVLEQWQVVAVKGENLLYPAFAMNSKGKGVIGFSVSGPSYFPSAGYITINDKGVLGDKVHLTAVATVPLDDFTAYFTDKEAPARFGDWSTAVVDEKGSVWVVEEYATAIRRTPRTNWATYIFKLDV